MNNVLILCKNEQHAKSVYDNSNLYDYKYRNDHARWICTELARYTFMHVGMGKCMFIGREWDTILCKVPSNTIPDELRPFLRVRKSAFNWVSRSPLTGPYGLFAGAGPTSANQQNKPATAAPSGALPPEIAGFNLATAHGRSQAYIASLAGKEIVDMLDQTEDAVWEKVAQCEQQFDVIEEKLDLLVHEIQDNLTDLQMFLPTLGQRDKVAIDPVMIRTLNGQRQMLIQITSVRKHLATIKNNLKIGPDFT